MDDLPPLAALRVIEAAGRLGSFTKAASELGITQAAVSRQVAGVERALGISLFLRHGRGVELTEAGTRYIDAIRSAFRTLTEATAILRRGMAPPGKLLRVTVQPSFATIWLVPRLKAFEAEHPDIQLVIEPDHRAVPLGPTPGRADGPDLAIRYGRGGWPGLRCRLLRSECLYPVCAPALADDAAPLQNRTLLLTSLPVDWLAWAEGSGIDIMAGPRRLVLHDYNIVIEAALRGQGIAMGRELLVGSLIADGRLVRASDRSVRDVTGYYLVAPETVPESTAAASFGGWLERCLQP